jgi:hypothetical protein
VKRNFGWTRIPVLIANQSVEASAANLFCPIWQTQMCLGIQYSSVLSTTGKVWRPGAEMFQTIQDERAASWGSPHVFELEAEMHKLKLRKIPPKKFSIWKIIRYSGDRELYACLEFASSCSRSIVSLWKRCVEVSDGSMMSHNTTTARTEIRRLSLLS